MKDDSDIDLVKEHIEDMPMWRTIQKYQNKIKTRKKNIKKAENEIDDLYQKIAELRCGMAEGDYFSYLSNPNVQYYVVEVEPIDDYDLIIWAAKISLDGIIQNDKIFKFDLDLMKAYKVEGLWVGLPHKPFNWK